MVILETNSSGHGHRVHILWILIQVISLSSTFSAKIYSNFTKAPDFDPRDMTSADSLDCLESRLWQNGGGDCLQNVAEKDFHQAISPANGDKVYMRKSLNTSVPRLMRELYSDVQKYGSSPPYDSDTVRSFLPKTIQKLMFLFIIVQTILELGWPKVICNKLVWRLKSQN